MFPLNKEFVRNHNMIESSKIIVSQFWASFCCICEFVYPDYVVLCRTTLIKPQIRSIKIINPNYYVSTFIDKKIKAKINPVTGRGGP
jgi:uncharacterized protein YjaG (DUF416 family)